jgi:hypothetical protein
MSLFAMLVVIAGLALAEDQEMKINKRDLPAPVLTAFQRECPQAKIIGAARETENDSVYYEIESKQGGVRRDLRYQPDGTLNVVEERMRPRDLPSLIHDSVIKEYPKGKITSAEKITRRDVSSYEVVVKDHKKLLEIAVAADGTITKIEEKTDKDND